MRKSPYFYLDTYFLNDIWTKMRQGKEEASSLEDLPEEVKDIVRADIREQMANTVVVGRLDTEKNWNYKVYSR